MGRDTQGRRVPVTENHGQTLAGLQPGDYCGPITGYSGNQPAVFFVPPDSQHTEGPLHHVCSPPHRFTEEPDGSLTIRDSIGCGKPPYDWHGYLTAGVWEER